MDTRALRYDCHTHVGMSLSFYFDGKYPTCHDMVSLLEKLDRSDVDRAIVFPLPDHFASSGVQALSAEQNRAICDSLFSIPYAWQNERLILEAKRLGRGRILTFGMFSLCRGVEEQVATLDRHFLNGEMFGLKYYADTDRFDLNQFADVGKPFIDLALRHNVPIVFHISQCSSLGGVGYSFPEGVMTLAKRYPALRVSIAHMAHFNEAILKESQALENVFFDLSPFLHLCHIRKCVAMDPAWRLPYDDPEAVLKIVASELPNKLMWGTDMPVNYTCDLNCDSHDFQHERYTLEENYRIFRSLPAASQRALETNNVERFLYG